MELQRTLEEIGLGEGEAKIYLALLKRGKSKVHDLAKEAGMHRTTIYDFLRKLQQKGLASYVIENNVQLFQATGPSKLLDYLKEKEGKTQQILPALLELAKFHEEPLRVEVFSGKEGFKSVLSDTLRVGKGYVVLGADEIMFKRAFGDFMDWFFEKERQAGYHERILTADDVDFVYSSPNVHYRYLPRAQFNPTTTLVWGDNVAILIWEPLTVIKIQHAALADSYLKYFEMLWTVASERPKKRSSKAT